MCMTRLGHSRFDDSCVPYPSPPQCHAAASHSLTTRPNCLCAMHATKAMPAKAQRTAPMHYRTRGSACQPASCLNPAPQCTQHRPNPHSSCFVRLLWPTRAPASTARRRPGPCLPALFFRHVPARHGCAGPCLPVLHDSPMLRRNATRGCPRPACSLPYTATTRTNGASIVSVCPHATPLDAMATPKSRSSCCFQVVPDLATALLHPHRLAG